MSARGPRWPRLILTASGNSEQAFGAIRATTPGGRLAESKWGSNEAGARRACLHLVICFTPQYCARAEPRVGNLCNEEIARVFSAGGVLPIMRENHQKHRVLVVEDHQYAARIVGRMLLGEGLEPIFASDGREAMDRLGEEDFDAVISDVEMPGMGGFELLQNTTFRLPRLPVILMTAFPEKGMREAALGWGARALLEKPFNREQLTAALALALAGARAPGRHCPRPERCGGHG